MKTNKEVVLASETLTSDGRMMAKCLMQEDGVSIEGLFNLLGQLQSDVIELQRSVRDMDSAIDQAQYDIDCHIRDHD
jgi:hypothetical protein